LTASGLNDRFSGESRQSTARFSARWLESPLRRHPARNLKAVTQPQAQGQGTAQLFFQHDALISGRITVA
jgi:hypothetical protein